MATNPAKPPPSAAGDVIRRRGRPHDPATAQDALAVELHLFLEGSDEEPASRREAERLVALAKMYPSKDPQEVVVPPERELYASSLQTAVRQHVKRTRGRAKALGQPAGATAAHALSWQVEADRVAARSFCRGCEEDALPHYHCEQCRRLVGGPNVLRGNVTVALESELVALVCDYKCWELLKQARAGR